MPRNFSPIALMEALARARLTLQQLAEKADLSFQQINKYEKGRITPRDTTVVLLADALGIPPNSLYIEQ
jgi:transcriptional regulator with XRE-family HTH domain